MYDPIWKYNMNAYDLFTIRSLHVHTRRACLHVHNIISWSWVPHNVFKICVCMYFSNFVSFSTQHINNTCNHSVCGSSFIKELCTKKVIIAFQFMCECVEKRSMKKRIPFSFMFFFLHFENTNFIWNQVWSMKHVDFFWCVAGWLLAGACINNTLRLNTYLESKWNYYYLLFSYKRKKS